MILCDSNVWLALALGGHSLHTIAREWLDKIEKPAVLVFCRATQQSLVRLLTNSAVLGAFGNQPLTNLQAWAVYEAFVADDRVVYQADEPPGLEAQWKKLALRDTPSPKLWMDAYLAAFAMTSGYRMVTGDLGYRQFEGLELQILRPTAPADHDSI